ncbi:Outer membrane protein assembly factor BamB, contains PQQ-like beta-propeller repeat [Poseidonocella pacifica]|uniref:Outer membrane protein assembly factor BamB, contains PQQ-like beta-propeller repeat n=1 Tax=Poseidonocella pacifica TaxID=871651 RepID=A0A1I0YQW0_9RHOB|nr:PQQ-binding-like beta-propeller repeat protein [Poseidonocella pacifica]SFB15704.1 Outer membrane protein assembly factor BamB, contains PQQ-like beta-propeller repeat [Poseidonocella pacifica]
MMTIKGQARLSGALLLVATLAACGGARDIILSGPREPLRAEGERQSAPDAVNRSAAISFAAPRVNANWPQLGGSAAHVIDHPALAAQPSRLWSTKIGAGDSRRRRITAEPVVSGGRVFTLDAGAQVAATSTGGAPLWTANLTPAGEGEHASGGGLAVAGDTLYVTTGFGRLSALDVTTGAVRWHQQLDASASGAPTVSGDLVYVVGRDNRAWAVGTRTGRVEWTFGGSPSDPALTGGPAPAVSGDLVVLPFSGGELVAAFRQGGLPRWQGSVAGSRPGFASSSISDMAGDPVIADGRVFAANYSGRIGAFALSDGERLWTARDGAAGPVVAAGGSLFVVTDQNKLARFDAATGARIWAVDLPFFTTERERRQVEIYAHYGPVLAGGRIWTASSDGFLRAFDPRSGALVGSTEIPGGASTAPIVAGNTLYVVGTGGDLHAFR